MKLGILALWHEVTERGVVRQGTANMVKKYMPDEFDALVAQPLPATLEGKEEK